MLIHWYRIANWLHEHRVPLLPVLIYYIQHILFNCAVPPGCKLGKGVKFGYGGIAVVIHRRAVVGENCVIGTGVVIGGRSKHREVPVIGNNVYISTGAKILGPVTIGDNVMIGANAVVVKNVPSNCVVAGVPAKILKENINMADYL